MILVLIPGCYPKVLSLQLESFKFVGKLNILSYYKINAMSILKDFTFLLCLSFTPSSAGKIIEFYLGITFLIFSYHVALHTYNNVDIQREE